MINFHGLPSMSGRLLAASLGRTGRPYKLTFGLTMRCPYECSFCHGAGAPEVEEAPLEKIVRFLERNKGFSWIDLTGGEIFCREDLGGILAALRRLMPGLAVLHFPTSGAEPELVRSAAAEHRAKAGGRLVVTVSVNGPPDVDSELRGRPESFARSVETFKLLRKIPGVQAYFGVTLVPRNASLVGETFDSLRGAVGDLSFQDLHFNFFNRSPHFFGNMDVDGLTREQAAKAVVELSAGRGRQNMRSPLDLIERAFLRLMPRHLDTGRSPARCVSLLANVYVAPDLTVYPCTIWDRPLGRLDDFDYDMAGLLQSDVAREARAMIAEDRCPGCWTPCEAFPSLLDPLWALSLRRKSLRQKG